MWRPPFIKAGVQVALTGTLYPLDAHYNLQIGATTFFRSAVAIVYTYLFIFGFY